MTVFGLANTFLPVNDVVLVVGTLRPIEANSQSAAKRDAKIVCRSPGFLLETSVVFFWKKAPVVHSHRLEEGGRAGGLVRPSATSFYSGSRYRSQHRI